MHVSVPGQVEEALSAEAKERSSIGQLNARLLDLQSSIAEAEQKLAVTRTRVDQNLQKVTALKQEAVSCEASGEGMGLEGGKAREERMQGGCSGQVALQRQGTGLGEACCTCATPGPSVMLTLQGAGHFSTNSVWQSDRSVRCAWGYRSVAG